MGTGAGDRPGYPIGIPERRLFTRDAKFEFFDIFGIIVIMNKKDLSKTDIRTKFITPAIAAAPLGQSAIFYVPEDDN